MGEDERTAGMSRVMTAEIRARPHEWVRQRREEAYRDVHRDVKKLERR